MLAYLSIGTMAAAEVVPASAVVPMPDGVPPEVAALIGCGVSTGVGAVVKTAEVPAGATVAVIGLGGVGLSCVMGAALAGASRIIAVDVSRTKIDLARDLGATHRVHADPARPAATVDGIRSAAGHGGPDFVFEAIGLPATIAQAIAALPPGGTAVLVGLTRFGESASFEAFPFVDGGRRILGSNYGSAVAAIDFPKYAEAYLAGPTADRPAHRSPPAAGRPRGRVRPAPRRGCRAPDGDVLAGSRAHRHAARLLPPTSAVGAGPLRRAVAGSIGPRRVVRPRPRRMALVAHAIHLRAAPPDGDHQLRADRRRDPPGRSHGDASHPARLEQGDELLADLCSLGHVLLPQPEAPAEEPCEPPDRDVVHRASNTARSLSGTCLGPPPGPRPPRAVNGPAAPVRHQRYTIEAGRRRGLQWA